MQRIMLVRLRDLLWLLIVFLLATISLVEYRAVANMKRLLLQKESELAAAESSEARLKSQIRELQEAIDGYEKHAELIRRFLLTKPQR